MSKKHRKNRPTPAEKPVKCCFDCANCMYIGEGDHLCDVNMELITDDWEPTEMFYHCGGKEFVEI